MALDTRSKHVTTLLATASHGDQQARDAVSLALALDRGTGRYWAALPFQPPDGAIETGRRRGEVAGLVETSAGWYQPGRPRIDQWLASQR